MEENVAEQERDLRGESLIPYMRPFVLTYARIDLIRRAKGQPNKTGNMVGIFYILNATYLIPALSFLKSTKLLLV